MTGAVCGNRVARTLESPERIHTLPVKGACVMRDTMWLMIRSDEAAIV
jgi:hypothetical protein